MKKIILLISLLLIPINIYAYSDSVYRGGYSLGIEVNTKGVLIVGFYAIGDNYNKSDLKIGDYIIRINDIEVNSLKELTEEIEKNKDDEKVEIRYLRNNKEYTTTLNLILDNGVYKTGLYVKDNITGIGTLTYIDPQTKIFGALGHEIIESNSNKIVEIKSGNIFENEIVSIDKSSVGHAGSKNAKYYYNNKYGTISKNSIHGIFGNYTANLDDMELVSVADKKDIKVGEASIYTVIDEEKVDEFKIRITSINETSSTKNIIFEITDERLIEKTGGVVQGMSGSPIMQDNKIIGVVTHVIVDNPLTGYGLFITNMLEESEKVE